MGRFVVLILKFLFCDYGDDIVRREEYVCSSPDTSPIAIAIAHSRTLAEGGEKKHRPSPAFAVGLSEKHS